MKSYALDIPESQEDLAGWLTSYLLSPKLALLIAELAAVHAGKPAPRGSLDDVIGNNWEAVLADGLGVLPHPCLVQFLQRPLLLLDLQGRVLAQGGPAWNLPPAADGELRGERESGWLRLQRSIDEEQWLAFAPAEEVRLPAERRWFAHPLFASLATAALLLAAAFVWNWKFAPPRADEWGWNRPGVLARSASREEYLDNLAAGADEWFDRQPVTRVELARRMLELRRGCTTLGNAPHQLLTSDDRDWLQVERADIARMLDEQMQRLDRGEDVLTVRKTVDARVDRFVGEVRSRE